jgi:hypothetical protein
MVLLRFIIDLSHFKANFLFTFPVASLFHIREQLPAEVGYSRGT